MEGINFVRLQGYLQSPVLSSTKNNTDMFRAKIAIPVVYTDRASGEQKEFNKFMDIVAWDQVASTLGSFPEGTPIWVEGEIDKRSTDSTCRSCASPEKRQWVNITVRNFGVVE